MHSRKDRSLLFEGLLDELNAAFSALSQVGAFVFARLLQQETVQARVVVGAGLQVNSPVAARFAADATLTAALATVRVGAVPDGAEIDLTILERTSEPAGSGNVLTYMCGSEDLQLWLDFDAADLAPLSASDFLEKIGLVLDRLGAEPDMRCSKLVLLTRAARGGLSQTWLVKFRSAITNSSRLCFSVSPHNTLNTPPSPTTA